MPKLSRFIPAVIALGVLPLTNAWAADAAPSTQTSSGTIIWDAKPAPATPGPNGTIIWNDSPSASQAAPRANASPDKNGITWDTPRKGQPQASAAPDKNGITWNSSGKTAPPPVNTADATGPCREFQTHIIIDGKSEPAHGTACRQPDGTWRVVNR